MIEATAENERGSLAARVEKPVTTTVHATLDYLFALFAHAEDLQYQKNLTNQRASGTVMWKGVPFLADLPIDQLLGLEARLAEIRLLFLAMPTIDASKTWKPAPQIGNHIWEIEHPEIKTKTDKRIVPVLLHPATPEHPANVQAVSKDVIVGHFKDIHRSGAVTAQQKADAIMRIDELSEEVKKARQRANEAEVMAGTIGMQVVRLLLEPLQT